MFLSAVFTMLREADPPNVGASDCANAGPATKKSKKVRIRYFMQQLVGRFWLSPLNGTCYVRGFITHDLVSYSPCIESRTGRAAGPPIQPGTEQVPFYG